MHFMKKNIGNFDRILRLSIATTLIALNAKGLIFGGVAVGAIIISVIFLLTGLFGFCPVYELSGINSRKTG
jgi:Protein of unknown function (DUF2892)